MIDRVEVHKELLDNMHDIYVKKNHDYGDSVHETYERYGMTSFLVRMEDKMNRIRTLDKAEDIKVTDEQMEDTLLDLANYAILAIIELKRGKARQLDCGKEKNATIKNIKQSIALK